MRARRALGWTLLVCLQTALGEAGEPKDFVEENLERAHDVLEAGFVGCQLWMQISYSGKADEAFRVEIQLEKMDPAAFEVDQNLGIRLVAKEGASPVTSHAGGAHSESRFRIYVGDRALAEALAENLARVTAICNLYDCPDGKLCKDRIEEAQARAAAAPRRETTPELSQDEIDRALAHDRALATELLIKIRWETGDQEAIKAVLRTLPMLGHTDLDAVREKYHLPRPQFMPPDQKAFYDAFLGARFGDSRPVRAFLDAGGEIERQATNRESSSLAGYTLLLAAIVGNHIEIVRVLLARGADLNRPGQSGHRPIDIAADDRRAPILELLLQRGASTGRSMQERTPLWNAAAQDNPEAIKLLLRHGANPNELGTYDEPPLYRAALNGHVEAARLLLAGGANVNGTDDEGQTPLMAAIVDGSIPTMELLLAHGARIDHRDNEGEDALELAREMRKHEVVNWLVAHGAMTEVDRLRRAWAAARPASTPPSVRPAKPRPCREDVPVSALAEVWNDPEYQDFVRRLQGTVPPLGLAEASQSTADLLDSALSELGNLLPLILGSLQGEPKDSDSADSASAFAGAGPRMLAIAGHVLTHREHVVDMTGDQLFDAMTTLQLGLLFRFSSSFRTLSHAQQREGYDLLHSASDLLGLLVPCESLPPNSQMFAGLLPSLLAAVPPPVGPARAPEEAGTLDIERLRQRLGPWLERIGLAAPAFALLDGGLPGHIPAGGLEVLSARVGDKLPWLILFYRPDAWRGKLFRCTAFEEKLVADLAQSAGACTSKFVEIGLLLRLLSDASESGEALDAKRRYEAQFISLFLFAHYRQELERIRPGLGPELLDWASGFLQSVDLISSPPDTLSPPFEVLMQEGALERLRNPPRAWELYGALREVLSY